METTLQDRKKVSMAHTNWVIGYDMSSTAWLKPGFGMEAKVKQVFKPLVSDTETLISPQVT